MQPSLSQRRYAAPLRIINFVHRHDHPKKTLRTINAHGCWAPGLFRIEMRFEPDGEREPVTSCSPALALPQGARSWSRATNFGCGSSRDATRFLGGCSTSDIRCVDLDVPSRTSSTTTASNASCRFVSRPEYSRRCSTGRRSAAANATVRSTSNPRRFAAPTRAFDPLHIDPFRQALPPERPHDIGLTAREGAAIESFVGEDGGAPLGVRGRRRPLIMEPSVHSRARLLLFFGSESGAQHVFGPQTSRDGPPSPDPFLCDPPRGPHAADDRCSAARKRPFVARVGKSGRFPPQRRTVGLSHPGKTHRRAAVQPLGTRR